MEDKTNEIPNPDKWNSDEIVLDNLSCKQLARFMSAFILSYRALVISDVQGGTEMLIGNAINLLKPQLQTTKEGLTAKDGTKIPDDNMKLGISAIGLALCAAARPSMDCRSLADFGNQAFSILNSLVQTNGVQALDDNHIQYAVCKEKDQEGKDVIKMGASLVSHSQILQDMKKAEPIKLPKIKGAFGGKK